MQSPPPEDDHSGANFCKFELLLKKNIARKPAIYNTDIIKNNPEVKPQHVLDTVYSQIKMMQFADGKSSKNAREVNRVKKSSFLAVSNLPVYTEVPKQTNNFETQCFSNTQLINIIDDAEAIIDTHKGMTQEFDTTFFHKENSPVPFSDHKTEKENNRLETQEFEMTFTQTNVDKTVTFLHDTIERDDHNDHTQIDDEVEPVRDKIISQNDTQMEICEVTENKSPNMLHGSKLCIENHNINVTENIQDSNPNDPVGTDTDNKVIMTGIVMKEANYTIKQNILMEIDNIDKDRPPSPVLEMKSKKITKIPSNLVVPLESFEKFEMIAFPLMNANNDYNTSKYLINSQILGRELHLNTDENVLFKNDGQLSPIIERSFEMYVKDVHNNKTGIDKVTDLNDIQDLKDKQSNSLLDEILFSSDEENDFIYKEFKDMPLTAALETSFYDHSDVFEKTMYVGFQTASNKSIQIDTNSFQKAQYILDEDENINSTNFSLNELVEICDEKNFSTVSSVKLNEQDKINKLTTEKTNSACHKEAQIKIIERDPNKDQKNNLDTKMNVLTVTDKDGDTHKTLEKQNFVEFKTASNKNIELSEKALDLGRKVFVEIDEKKNVNQEKFNVISERVIATDIIEVNPNGSNYSNNDIGDNINDDLFLQEFENIEMSLEEREISDESKNDYMGFKTASNKNIALSDAAKAKVKEVFQDIDLGVINETTEKLDNIDTEATPLIGFKTANKNNTKVSTQALAKTKNIFQDIYIETKPDDDHKIHPIDITQPSTSTAFVGFKTANNKNIKISEMAIAKSSKIFKDIDSDNNQDFDVKVENPKLFEGFKTASNKIVNISEQSLHKSRILFRDMDKNCYSENTEEVDNACFSGFKTVNHSTIADIARSKKQFEDLNTENAYDYKPCESKNQDHAFKGFQTASKKPVKVSTHALERSKQLFQDINDSKPVKINSIAENSLINDETKISEDKVTKKAIESEIPHKPFVFQTASNKKVDISKEAIEKTKALFSDIEIPKQKEQGIFKGFQTASHKKVEISKEAIEKTKALFSDIVTELNEEHTFKGFQTANNKNVDVSEEDLKKTKALFNDIKVPRNIEHEYISGFQTASKKKVVVSVQALAKSRQVLQEIDKQTEVYKDKDSSEEKENIVNQANSIFSFKTANNNNSNVSKDALLNSRKLLEDITVTEKKTQIGDVNKAYHKKSPKNSIIDTQILDNFKESFCTEDFRNTEDKTPRNKRSGSPILSCPRAKKRKKFETPYKDVNVKIAVDVIETKDENSMCTTKIKFNENYKKNKIFTLKDLTKLGDNNKKNIDPYILQFNLDNILNFEFVSNRNEIANTKMCIEELKNAFLSAVNGNLIPEGWLDNHLKLILWKLLSYEAKYRNINLVCTVQNVIDQLKYRYDKELYNAERPAFRKILEKDDVSTKTMVLCVASVYKDGASVKCVTSSDSIELLLTDGWYFIKTTIDKMLSKLVCDGRIAVGCKIVTNGAELLNCDQGIAPWEDTSAVRLKLFGNSTRPARWDARLGFARAAILPQLSAVRVDGGKVARLRVFVTRVYPLLYVEKFGDGSTVTRSERLEHLHQMKYEAERELMMERIYEDVQRELSDQESQASDILDSGKRGCCDSGSQLAKMMKRSADPMEFRAQLTASQVKLLQDHTSRYREKVLEVIQKRIQEKVASRNVVTLARGRIAAVDGGRVTKGMLSVWKPNEAVLDLFREGAWIEIMNVIPTAIRYSEIQITAGRQSLFRQRKCESSILPHLQSLKRTIYKISDVAENPLMTTDYNEIDTVGIVFLIEPSNEQFESSRNFQNVYLADADKNIISVNFWGGVKKFGFENILDTGQIVACANLQKRAGNTRKSIPQFRVTEFSYFTKTPKNTLAREMVDDFDKKLYGLDRRKFCDDCVAIKSNYTAIRCLNNDEIESTYRLNKSEYSFARNKMFIDTPLGVKSSKNEDVIFNLTGLDFDSSFKHNTQELSPKTMQRKRKVNEKIAKLQMYGEPPPLSSINIINKSINTKSSYKSPLISTNSSVATSNLPLNSAATVNIPDESPKTTISPVTSLKRTGNKSVPVKLNFTGERNNDLVDHFGEEFDGSPPLSLD